MTQQQISTPSIDNIEDSKILSSNSYGGELGIAVRDPWDSVLSDLAPFALDPLNIVPALDNTAIIPSAINPLVTASHFSNRLGDRTFQLIGPIGSGADYETSDESGFVSALASLSPGIGGWLVVLPGSYIFNASVSVPSSVRISGVHPVDVHVVSSGDFPVFSLTGDNSSIERLSLYAPVLVSSPAIQISGTRTLVEFCQILNFSFAGVSLGGLRSTVRGCRFSSYYVGSFAVLVQQQQHRIQNSSFSGSLPAGVWNIEGSECEFLGNYIDSSVLGPSFYMPSSRSSDNRLIANNYGSSSSLASSVDNGTNTVRYANTPNTFSNNQNNVLIAPGAYVGQPTLTTAVAELSDDPVLGGPFTASAPASLNSLYSGLDAFIKDSYEDRNIFLSSSDPVYNPDGSPLSGVFTWDGTTITWPAFKVYSPLGRAATWLVNAGSSPLPPGEALALDLDRSLSGVDITLTPTLRTLPLSLNSPSTAQQFSLAVGLPGGQAVWLNGYRLLTALTSFDVDGWPLPVTRYIGMTETRNPTAPYDGFAGATASSPLDFTGNLTQKLGAQSSLTKLLYERSNIGLQRETDDACITTDPAVGSWLASSELSTSLPEVPTHFVSLGGQAYALLPNTGLYRYSRVSYSWALVVGNPGGGGPYTALSPLGTGLGLLKTNGQIVHYNPDGPTTWSIYTPTIPSSLTLPFASTRSSSYTAGQADYALQTPNYTLFSTLDGRTVRFNQSTDLLDEIPRVVAEGLGTKGLQGFHLKDTGYNIVRDPDLLTESGDNGCGSYLSGLPQEFDVTRFANIVIGTTKGERTGLATVAWDQVTVENFAYDYNSGAFLALTKYPVTGDWYLFFGGLGTVTVSRLAATDPVFNDVSVQTWSLNPYTQEVTGLGPRPTTGAFSALYGKWDPTTSTFAWSTQTLGLAGTCDGVVAVLDRYAGGNGGSGDLIAFVSDPSRTNRPTWWRRSSVSGLWSRYTLTNSFAGGTDVAVPACVANCYASTLSGRTGAFGVASAKGVSFLFRDASRSGRPTMVRYDRSTATFSAVRLAESAGPTTDVVLAGATTSSMYQVVGSTVLSTFNSIHFASSNGSGGYTVFTQFENSGSWSSSTLGTGGTYFNSINMSSPSFTKRTGTLLAGRQGQLPLGGTKTESLYLWTPNYGLVQGTLTGNALTTVSGQSWSRVNPRQPTDLPMFSWQGAVPNTYQVVVGGGGSRGGDLTLQLCSHAERSTRPLQSAAVTGGGLVGQLKGLAWFEPGVKVKNPSSRIWLGLNRAGYLWLGDTNYGPAQTELTPNPSTVRGDITISGLGIAGDYDYAFDGTGNKLAIVWADQSNSNYLSFLLYDLSTGNFTLERFGVAPLLGTYVVPLASVPRISFNAATNSWDVVAQDDSRTGGGQLVFYRRSVGSSTWVGERVGTNGDKSLFSMIAQAGRSPARPLCQTNGDVVVATEDRSSGSSVSQLQICVRLQASSGWSFVHKTTGVGGFTRPELVRTLDGSQVWALGTYDSGASMANIAISPTGGTSGGVVTNDWSLFAYKPSSYNRTLAPLAVSPQTASVLIASSLRTENAVPSQREMGVWNLKNSGSTNTSGFTAKGRLQTGMASGEEEDQLQDPSWTSQGSLLYGAVRPGRSYTHWSLRSSSNGWTAVGESLLGAGRLLTHGYSQVREQYVSEPAQDLIVEMNVSGGLIRGWQGRLPLALRAGLDDYLSIRWPQPADSTPSALFAKGSPSVGFTPESGLQSGSLGVVTSRSWPVVLGNTRCDLQPGPSTFYQGAVLGVYPPVGSTNLTYFGSSVVGTNNLFRLKAIPAVTFNGTFTLKTTDPGAKTYTLVGPLTFLVDPIAAQGQHLVLSFNNSGSLVLDSAANPLSYWLSLNASVDSYPIVLGEVGAYGFVLYPIVRQEGEGSGDFLTFGHFEPSELSLPLARWKAPTTRSYTKLHPDHYYMNPISTTQMSFQRAGSIRGLQPQTFTSSRQLLLYAGFPGGGAFLAQRDGLNQGPVGSAQEFVYPVAALYQNVLVWEE